MSFFVYTEFMGFYKLYKNMSKTNINITKNKINKNQKQDAEWYQIIKKYRNSVSILERFKRAKELESDEVFSDLIVYQAS